MVKQTKNKKKKDLMSEFLNTIKIHMNLLLIFFCLFLSVGIFDPTAGSVKIKRLLLKRAEECRQMHSGCRIVFRFAKMKRVESKDRLWTGCLPTKLMIAAARCAK